MVPESPVFHLGNIEAGTRVTAKIRLQNLTNRPVRVVGAHADCGCIAHDDLPIEVPARSSADFNAHFTSPGVDPRGADANSGSTAQPQIIARHIKLFVDVAGPPLMVKLDGTVVPPAAGPEPDLAEPDLAAQLD